MLGFNVGSGTLGLRVSLEYSREIVSQGVVHSDGEVSAVEWWCGKLLTWERAGKVVALLRWGTGWEKREG
ncbi:unnamed protein product [Amaranthus hypochondriacus]